MTGVAGPVDPAVGQWAEMRALIESAIMNAPRSLQRRIGPSELGDSCGYCLTAKLTGHPSAGRERSAPWLPAVGTAVHAWLAGVFEALGESDPGRWLVEQRVDVGEVDGEAVTGSCDLFDARHGAVWDWKVVGVTTLRSATRGPSDVYRRQAHLYGRGYQRAGYDVRTVGVVYLPRNHPSLRETVVWSEPYDEAVATGTLARAESIVRAGRLVGADALLATQSSAPECYACLEAGRVEADVAGFWGKG